MDFLEYKGYRGSVEYSKADNCLCGGVLGMTKDLIIYEGKTIEELKADFEAGIESYLEGCREMGITPRKPCSGTLQVRLPIETHGKAAMYAERQGISLNAFIRDSVEKRLQSVGGI